VSSIAVVGQYGRVTGESIVPETSMRGVECVNELGYARAKFVCERMIESVREECQGSMEIGYVRVGQMSGNEGTGYWNGGEHIPALISASKAINKLPKLEGVSFSTFLFFSRLLRFSVVREEIRGTDFSDV